MPGSLELEPTAALVIDWSKDLYLTGSAASFVSHLDLAEGYRLRQECDAVCPWYAEVIMNRKWFIRHIASFFISALDGPCQILILAAGKTPLALELLETSPEQITVVIETDIAGMEEKQEIYQAIAPAAAKKIQCVHADLYDPIETKNAVASTGIFDPDRPTIIVFEGISYYLPPSVSSGILSQFASEHRHKAVILDFLLPCWLVRHDRRYIPREIWGIIHRDCHFQKTTTYSLEEIEGMLISAGCDQVRHHAMDEIERLRTAKNVFFPFPADGWITISTARL